MTILQHNEVGAEFPALASGLIIRRGMMMKKIFSMLAILFIIVALIVWSNASQLFAAGTTESIISEATTATNVRTAPYTVWNGPTQGPKISPGKRIVVINQNSANGGVALWGEGVAEACKAAGWECVMMDGKEVVTVQLACISQAISLKADGIVTSAITAALQTGILEALEYGIPTVGIHASATVGPDKEENLLYNNTSDPIEIANAMADFVIADSKGKGRVIILYVDSHSIANAKGNAMKKRIEECDTMELLDFVTIGNEDLSTVLPSLMTSWVATHGTNFYVLSVADAFFDYMIPTLRNGGIGPDEVKLVGSDGENAAYERIRAGEYQIATVPEPSTMFGYMCVDELNRFFNGEEQFVWSPQLHIVTKDNVDTEGGNESIWIPSNNFADKYAEIWKK
jgi:ribose transport system substrate-binding protein